MEKIIIPHFFINVLILLGTFLVAMTMVNRWVRYRTWHDDRFIVQQIYTRKRLFWLYSKCWAILLAIVTLFWWVEMEPLMYLLVLLLGVLAMAGVVYGENLAEVKLLQSQSENLMLRSQLNPHFLYNTLNNIDALIWLDQEKASSAVTNLSQLMRYFTYSARQEHVSVGEEVEHLSQLVALQRLRMPREDTLVYTTEIDQPKTQIVPLLLLPLMENAFKHAGDLSQTDAIRIRIILKDGVLEYYGSNNVCLEAPDPVSKSRRKGVGMSVLRRRLDLLYGSSYQLEANLVGERYQVYLRIEP